MQQRNSAFFGPDASSANAEPVRQRAISEDVQCAIGKKLRIIYAEVTEQAVPQHFTDLLRKLDRRVER